MDSCLVHSELLTQAIANSCQELLSPVLWWRVVVKGCIERTFTAWKLASWRQCNCWPKLWQGVYLSPVACCAIIYKPHFTQSHAILHLCWSPVVIPYMWRNVTNAGSMARKAQSDWFFLQKWYTICVRRAKINWKVQKAWSSSQKNSFSQAYLSFSQFVLKSCSNQSGQNDFGLKSCSNQSGQNDFGLKSCSLS